MFHLCI